MLKVFHYPQYFVVTCTQDHICIGINSMAHLLANQPSLKLSAQHT